MKYEMSYDLDELIKNNYHCSIKRDYISTYPIYCFPICHSENLLLIEVVEDFLPDGYKIIRNTRGRFCCVADALGNTETYTNDISGKVKTKTDRNGDDTDYYYDSLSRPSGFWSGDGLCILHYDAFDNLTYTSGYYGRTDYSYDNFCRLTSETRDGYTKAYTNTRGRFSCAKTTTKNTRGTQGDGSPVRKQQHNRTVPLCSVFWKNDMA